MDLLEIKNAALSCLKPAETEILKWFRTDFSVETKSDQSPVTIADKNAEEILRKKLSGKFPGFGIIGEEFGNENSSAEWVWTIDPIDGTRSFIRGLPLFSTLLALLHNGEPVIGIVSFPALKERVWAVKNKGAFCGSQKLRVSRNDKLDRAVIATGDRYCFKMQNCLKLFNQLNQKAALVRTYPDAFGHYMAIRGAVDVMVDPLAYIWDYAPCKILALEAGGAFENFSGDKSSLTASTALTGNPQLVKQIRKLYKKLKNTGSA